MSKRGLLLLLPAFILIAAAINMPFAVWCSDIPVTLRGTQVLNLFGPEAVKRSWPSRTPHTQPWPAMQQYSVERLRFGAVRVTGWATDPDSRSTSHQMTTTRYGWPMASLQSTQTWWPQGDPAWVLPAQANADGIPRPMIRWSGTLLNPLLAGLSIWVVLVGFPWLWSDLNVRTRRRRGLCTACGYPLEAAVRCPECGLAAPGGCTAPANPAAPT
jgi:hypothetical protein